MDGDGVSHELDRVNVKFTMYIIQDIRYKGFLRPVDLIPQDLDRDVVKFTQLIFLY